MKTILPILLLCGCSMMPATKHESAATKAADSIANQQSMTVEKTVELQAPTLTAFVPQPGTEPQQIKMASPSAILEAPVQSVMPSSYISSGQGYRSSVKVTSASGQTAGSNTAADSAFSITLPLGVKLILLALGIILFIVAIWLAKRSSPAVAAAVSAGERGIAGAVKAADQVISTQIQTLRSRAMKATDPSEIAIHATDIARLEGDRGRLAKDATEAKEELKSELKPA